MISTFNDLATRYNFTTENRSENEDLEIKS